MTKQLIKCSKCGRFDNVTTSATRCSDCCYMRRKDKAGRLLASRCNECCPTGHGKHAALGATQCDLIEVKELNEALKSNLHGRLLTVSQPAAWIDRIEKLERHATQILERAAAMREALCEDTMNEAYLVEQYVKTDLVIHCCELELRRGIRKATKGYVENVVAKLFKKLLGE